MLPVRRDLDGAATKRPRLGETGGGGGGEKPKLSVVTPRSSGAADDDPDALVYDRPQLPHKEELLLLIEKLDMEIAQAELELSSLQKGSVRCLFFFFFFFFLWLLVLVPLVE